jgi:hypothetical protein
MPGNPYRDPESQLCEGASDPNSRRRQTDGRRDHLQALFRPSRISEFCSSSPSAAS